MTDEITHTDVMTAPAMTDEEVNEQLDELGHPGESKADRFRRLASARLNKLLKQFDLLANCSGYNYEYTPEQVATMLSHIDKRREMLAKAFSPEPTDEKVVL